MNPEIGYIIPLNVEEAGQKNHSCIQKANKIIKYINILDGSTCRMCDTYPCCLVSRRYIIWIL